MDKSRLAFTKVGLVSTLGVGIEFGARGPFECKESLMQMNDGFSRTNSKEAGYCSNLLMLTEAAQSTLPSIWTEGEGKSGSKRLSEEFEI